MCQEEKIDALQLEVNILPCWTLHCAAGWKRFKSRYDYSSITSAYAAALLPAWRQSSSGTSRMVLLPLFFFPFEKNPSSCWLHRANAAQWKLAAGSSCAHQIEDELGMLLCSAHQRLKWVHTSRFTQQNLPSASETWLKSQDVCGAVRLSSLACKKKGRIPSCVLSLAIKES